MSGLVTTQRGVNVTDEATDGESPADASVMQRIAGRARMLYEMLTGARTNEEDHIIPRNPQGTFGVDLSGPPYGACQYHPVLTFDCGMPLGNWSGGQSIPSIEEEPTIYTGAFWVKPFPATIADTPYSKLALSAILRADDLASETVTFSITINGREVELTQVATSTESVYENIGLVPVRPGRNQISIVITAPTIVEMYAMALNQIEHFSH